MRRIPQAGSAADPITNPVVPEQETEVIMTEPRPTSSRTRRWSERGEGVISTALAVLIIAFLGIALWTGFSAMMNDATDRTRVQVEQIGG